MVNRPVYTTLSGTSKNVNLMKSTLTVQLHKENIADFHIITSVKASGLK